MIQKKVTVSPNITPSYRSKRTYSRNSWRHEDDFIVVHAAVHITNLTLHFASRFSFAEIKIPIIQISISRFHGSPNPRIPDKNSIPARENAAPQLINDQNEATLAEFQKPAKCTDLSDSLKSLCRKIKSSGRLKFIISKRKESVSLRAEISLTIWVSVDLSRLVLDAVEFLGQKMEEVGVTDRRWACGMLVQVIFPEVSVNNGKKTVDPVHARCVVQRAVGVERWKEDLGDGELGPAEAVMFLHMVVGFGLISRFDQ